MRKIYNAFVGKELIKFLVDANAAGYATGDDSNVKTEDDGPKTITFESGDFRMHDNFFGGEPYGGREVVFHKDKPHWIMVYYGAVEERIKPDDVYGFLQESLKLMPEAAPFRGPENHERENMVYENSWDGDVEQFKGRETIQVDGNQVYWAEYVGGLVDQRI